jgi:hypothetical protein
LPTISFGWRLFLTKMLSRENRETKNAPGLAFLERARLVVRALLQLSFRLESSRKFLLLGLLLLLGSHLILLRACMMHVC